MKNKWSMICKLANKHYNAKEESVQLLFEQIFSELLGYSRLLREIDSHRSIRIGSTERVIPDIIIKNSERDLFIVELKQLNLNFDKRYEDQLFSYMRLLELKVGILICDAIYIYVFDNGNTLRSKIEFFEDNDKGVDFINLFSKGAFSVDKVKEFVLKDDEFEEHVQKIKEELETIDLRELVKLYFISNFEEAEIDEAFNGKEFIIEDTTTPPPPPPPPSGTEKIQDWVKRIFGYLSRNNVLSNEELHHLHDKDYCKQRFGIQFAMFVDTQRETIFSGRSRYWQKPIGKYYVCSQWWKEREKEYEANLIMWLNKVLPNYVELGLDRHRFDEPLCRLPYEL